MSVERLVVPVELASWEIECCGLPPAVGDAVVWPLLFHPGTGTDADGFDHAAPVVGRWRAERSGDGGLLLHDGPVVAYWSGDPSPEPGVVEAAGTLSATLHGGAAPDDAPTVSGVVRRLWVTSQLYAPRPEQGPRHCGPVAGTLEQRQVGRSPRWFDSRSSPTTGTQRLESGLLVELDVGPVRG